MHDQNKNDFSVIGKKELQKTVNSLPMSGFQN
jgi:hypothetical protein